MFLNDECSHKCFRQDISMQRKIQETFEQSHQTKLKLYRLVEKRQNLSAGHTTVYIFFSHDIPLQM